MKVCTDSCVFGAYIAEAIKGLELGIKDCLDIGSGTGLLSLMLAQKNNIIIDAVEIDASAYKQAKQNFEASPWKEKLNIFNEDIATFIPHEKYDLIISNPPFFENDLQSENDSSNAAKHSTSLTLSKLITAVNAIISEKGLFAVLLPFHRVDYFEKEALKLNFHLYKKLFVRQTPEHNSFRGILIFSRKKNQEKINELVIKDENGNYTDDFKKLLGDYYLYL